MAKENRLFKFEKQIKTKHKTKKQQQVSDAEDRVCGSEDYGMTVVVAQKIMTPTALKMMMTALKKRQRMVSKSLAARES